MENYVGQIFTNDKIGVYVKRTNDVNYVIFKSQKNRVIFDITGNLINNIGMNEKDFSYFRRFILKYRYCLELDANILNEKNL